ncbi:unnamed protein product [Sphagnum balticum]
MPKAPPRNCFPSGSRKPRTSTGMPIHDLVLLLCYSWRELRVQAGRDRRVCGGKPGKRVHQTRVMASTTRAAVAGGELDRPKSLHALKSNQNHAKLAGENVQSSSRIRRAHHDQNIENSKERQEEQQHLAHMAAIVRSFQEVNTLPGNKKGISPAITTTMTTSSSQQGSGVCDCSLGYGATPKPVLFARLHLQPSQKQFIEDELRNSHVGSYYYLLKNTHISDDYDITDLIPDQGSLVKSKGEDASNLDLDIGTDSSEHFDEEPLQFEQIDDENEFRDTKQGDLVRSEGLQQILQLILQEHVDGFMGEEIIDADDYED